MYQQHPANLRRKVCFDGSRMTTQSVDLVSCSASNFADSAYHSTAEAATNL
jgi:hypothetical protein